MDKLVSNWSRSAKLLPDDYVFPPDVRPGDVTIPLCRNIPVINLEKAVVDDQDDRSQLIFNACKEFGFFQVINHGVSENLMDETRTLFKEFFEMQDEDKAGIFSDDPAKPVRLYTSSYEHANEAVHFWRDNLQHTCYPLDDCLHLWPEKPKRYRDVVAKYSTEVRNLSTRILELICKGLGLESGYFGDELTGVHVLSVNHYPPCPDPSLTLGLPKHGDPNLITVLLQGDVNGLQVLKDGQWFGVEPLPNAFVINVGHQLKIISNGVFQSAEHRAVTNSTDARTTVVTSISPRYDSIIEPAKALVGEGKLPFYRSVRYLEFLNTYLEKKSDTDTTLEFYMSKLE